MPRKTQPLVTEFILLGLLAGRAMHGYDLFRELHAHPGLAMVWRVKQGMIYALLDKLAGMGYLQTELLPGGTHPPRKQYALTPAGQAAFDAWSRAPVDHPRDLRQDFLARLYFARLSGNPAALALLDGQKETCLTWQMGLQAQLDQAPPEAFEHWVIDFRIRQVQGMLAWLENCARELDHA